MDLQYYARNNASTALPLPACMLELGQPSKALQKHPKQLKCLPRQLPRCIDRCASPGVALLDVLMLHLVHVLDVALCRCHPLLCLLRYSWRGIPRCRNRGHGCSFYAAKCTSRTELLFKPTTASSASGVSSISQRTQNVLYASNGNTALNAGRLNTHTVRVQYTQALCMHTLTNLMACKYTR